MIKTLGQLNIFKDLFCYILLLKIVSYGLYKFSSKDYFLRLSNDRNAM